MNKAEAFTKFIKENINLLTSAELTRQAFRSKVREFFVDTHHKKFGVPKPLEVCESLVRYLIKNGISKDVILTQLDTLPIYKDLSSKNIIDLSLITSTHVSTLTEDELKRIDNTSTYTAIRDIESNRIIGEIEQRNSELLEQKETLEKLIAQKSEELASIPSILDEENIEEPDFNPLVEDVKPWWERFYLKANPFPGNKDGLSQIDKTLYENVVVKTLPYKQLLNDLERDLNVIFNTARMLVGEFGHGKTTFQDYLGYYLANNDILPVRITPLRSQPDCNGYYDYFTLKLQKELHKETGHTNIPIDPTTPDLIIEQCKTICKSKKGIVIFLDDYHKHRAEYSVVYDFFGTLQILKDELTRANCKVGFIVSAIPLWLKEAGDHQQMSGFFDSRAIVMPEPTPEIIRDVFNQRLSAYCYDSSPRAIEIGFIEKIFKIAESKGNYRDYLNRIIEELDNNNMAIVRSPIEIAETTLTEIRTIIENNPTLWSPLKKLLHESRFKRFNVEQISKCLELLVITHTQKKICEDEKIFTDNIYYFSRLKEVGLITKRRDASSQNEFHWTSVKSIENAAAEIHKKYGLTLTDYFLKLYSHNREIPENTTRGSGDNRQISNFKKLLSDNSNKIQSHQLANINQALVLYDRFDVDPSAKKKTDQAIEDIRAATSCLSNALFNIDGTAPYFTSAGISNIEDQWRLHHIDEELITQLNRKCEEYEKRRDSTQYALTVRHAKDVFSFILENLEQAITDNTNPQIDGFSFLHIQVRQNPDDIEIYKSIRSDIYSASKEAHYRYILQITDHLEVSFRNFLYTSTILIFGEENYFKLTVGAEDAKYAHKNIKQHVVVSAINNLYTGLTRPQLKQIFTQGSLVKKLIIDNLDISWTPEAWTLFFNIFVEENINTAHQKMDTFSPQNRSRYAAYCRLAAELIGAMNIFTAKIPINDCYFIKSFGSWKIDETLMKVGFKLTPGISGVGNLLEEDRDIFPKESDRERHIIEPEIFNKVKRHILSKISSDEHFFEDMLDVDYICNHYAVKYSEYIYSIGYMFHIERSIKISQWLGSRLMIRSSSR